MEKLQNVKSFNNKLRSDPVEIIVSPPVKQLSNMTNPASPFLKLFHKDLLKLWVRNTGSRFTNMIPMIYPEFKPDSLLFIGINPSFDPKAVIRVLKDTEFGEKLNTPEAVKDYFKFEPEGAQLQIANFQRIQQYHREKLNYFSRHRKLSQELNDTPWEQIDLFQARHSTQKDITDFLKLGNNTFFEEQITLFLNLLKIVAPKVIIVLNKTSGGIIKDLFDRNDKSLLTRIKENRFILSVDGVKIPFLISKHVQYKKEEERDIINQEIKDFFNNCP